MQRQRALTCVVAGLPLKAAAEALGLPLWLRRLPAQTLSAPLPQVPLDAEFAVAVASRIPAKIEEAAVWFGRIVHALEAVGRDFAIWIAKGPRLLPFAAMAEDFQWLVAWAWHSAHPGTRGHELLRRPWAPTMTWKKAWDEMAVWRKRIDLVAALGPGIQDPWFADGRALGFDIVALRTADDFIAESVAMENCLDQYARHLAYGSVRVFSVRRNGRRVADVELAPRSDDATMPGIAQLRGPRNRRVSAQIWQAVHAWLGSQPIRPLKNETTPAAVAREMLRSLWQPYTDAMQAIGIERRLEASSIGLPKLGERRPRRKGGVMLPPSTADVGTLRPARQLPSPP